MENKELELLQTIDKSVKDIQNKLKEIINSIEMLKYVQIEYIKSKVETDVEENIIDEQLDEFERKWKEIEENSEKTLENFIQTQKKERAMKC